MAKVDLDALLNELGLRKNDRAAAAPPEAPTPSPGRGALPAMPGSTPPIENMPAGEPGLISLDDLDELARTGATISPRSDEEANAPSTPAADPSTPSAPDASAFEQDTDRFQTEALATADIAGAAGFSADDQDCEEQAKDLRTLVLESGLLTAKQLSAAETIIKQSPGTRLMDILLEQGADEAKLFEALARSLRMPFTRLPGGPGSDQAYDDRLVQRLTPEFCKTNLLLPLVGDAGRTAIATARPDDVFLIDEVKLRLGGKPVRVVVTPTSDLLAILTPLTAPAEEDVNVDEILSDVEEDDVRVEKTETADIDLEKEAQGSPVIRYVNYIIQNASKEGASDIHIEPGDKTLKVRFRIDGELFESLHPPAKMAAAIISRLKIMANLDISERRLPQDGRIRCTVQNRKLDLRMSTIPTTYGEKVVLRILDTRSINVDLDHLGFDENTLTIWKNQIEQPHGIVLVTGPTGSGKTTTLYASLRAMDKKSQNISTVEDPVEYHLDGITQTQTHEKIGMTFARALKALLRQDPDVILLGEIRDQETAHTAVQAALTGHLVLSTLHTNDAPSSITRLVNIGLEPFLLGAAVNACLAQRLVRRICSQCKRPAVFTEEMREFIETQGMNPDELLEGEGCPKCRSTGHQGRLGIYELLVVDDHLRDVIARNPNVSEFRRMCVERGMVSLRQDGFVKVARGATTVQEIIRATESAA
ncbi:MAG: ATPase, T2SS/T4P/T4SS family [Planctomycetota bacterium]|nr:ATPase, T2SS/T4P/T4SS family [Planctomycetota bacterium]